MGNWPEGFSQGNPKGGANRRGKVKGGERVWERMEINRMEELYERDELGIKSNVPS